MHGVYLLWWVQERHVSAAAVAAILAAGDLAITLLEVPTGWLADRYGHRACLIAGSAVQTLGMVCCWLGEGVTGLLAANVIVALGDALRSGADQALLYRSCVALDREAEFQRIESRTHAATLVALVLMLMGGGAIVRVWGFAAGWIAEAALSLTGLVLAYAMLEPPPAPCVDTLPAATAVDSPRRPRPSLKSSAALALVILPASWLGGIAGAAAFYAQTSGWATVELSTFLVAALTLAEAAGAVIAARVRADRRSGLILAAGGTLLLAVPLVQPAAFVAVVVALSFVVGVAEPVRATAIQRGSADHVRARAASIASACDKAIATLTLIAAGVVPRRRT
jgi:MFS family permease